MFSDVVILHILCRSGSRIIWIALHKILINFIDSLDKLIFLFWLLVT